MEYNFSRISCDAICGIEKKLEKVCDNVVDDINNFVHVLNNPVTNEHSGEMNATIQAIMRDQVALTILQFTSTMDKVQKALAQYL